MKVCLFVYGSNILKCYTKEKSHFCGRMLCFADVLVLCMFSLIADIILLKL